MDCQLAQDRRELTARMRMQLGKGITDFRSTFSVVYLSFSSARYASNLGYIVTII